MKGRRSDIPPWPEGTGFPVAIVMNKKQQNSVARIRQEAASIERTVPLELKRSSQQRKKSLEKSWSSITTHAFHLNIEYPRLSLFYDPQQYLDHTRKVMEQVDALVEADILPTVEKSTANEEVA